MTRRLPLLLSLLLLSAATPACSLLVNFDECTTEADCAAGVACVEGICDAGAGPRACSRGSDCGGDKGVFCFAGACRVVDASRCQVSGNGFNNAAQNVILPIGALMPLTGSEGDRGQGTIAGGELALNQINNQGGLSAARFGLVICDTEYRADKAREVADYMHEELGIQAFIGAMSSSETLEVANQVAIPNNLLMISPASTSPAISGLNDKNLIWRTIASDSLQGPAMAKLIEARGFTKIALLSVDSAYGDGFADAIKDYWATTDPSLITDMSRFRQLKFSASDFTGQITTIGNTLFGSNGFQPQAIIVVGSSAALELIASLENRYIATRAEEDRPVWVGAEALRNSEYLATRFAPVWPRAIGTAILPSMSPLYARFASDYQAAFTNPPRLASNFPLADKAYDAAYLIALAYAAQDAPFKATGIELAQVLGRVSMGTRAEARPTTFTATATSLAKNGSINFEGVSGPLDFDERGDVFGDIASWSIEVDANNMPRFVDGPPIIVE
jgi:branched-chain amino acid transport system substrate-binding protein